MRQITQEGLNLVKAFEGFRSNIYLDSAGYSTIGYGRLLKKGEEYPIGITEAEASEFLQRDLCNACNGVIRLIEVPLKNNQFDALVDFTYNLGVGTLQHSTLRARLNRYDYNVYNEFLKYCYAGGVKSKGILRRRYAEANLYSL